LILRALLLTTALVAVGCGDDTTSGISMDMSQPVLDLVSTSPHCGGSVCTLTCSACVSFGGGVCAPPCMTSNPNSCNAPAMCKPLGGNPDAGGGATLVGNCAGMGFDGYCG
jgi:hypothetical protein